MTPSKEKSVKYSGLVDGNYTSLTSRNDQKQNQVFLSKSANLDLKVFWTAGDLHLASFQQLKLKFTFLQKWFKVGFSDTSDKGLVYKLSKKLIQHQEN